MRVIAKTDAVPVRTGSTPFMSKGNQKLNDVGLNMGDANPSSKNGAFDAPDPAEQAAPHCLREMAGPSLMIYLTLWT